MNIVNRKSEFQRFYYNKKINDAVLFFTSKKRKNRPGSAPPTSFLSELLIKNILSYVRHSEYIIQRY